MVSIGICIFFFRELYFIGFIIRDILLYNKNIKLIYNMLYIYKNIYVYFCYMFLSDIIL